METFEFLLHEFVTKPNVNTRQALVQFVNDLIARIELIETRLGIGEGNG